MIIEFYNASNEPCYIDIPQLTLSGDIDIVSVNIQTDSTSEIYTPIMYGVGTISLVTSDNSVYTQSLYGMECIITTPNMTYIGVICSQLNNAEYNYDAEIVELQICNQLTWAKSQVYAGPMEGTIYDIIGWWCNKYSVKACIDDNYSIVIGDEVISPLSTYVNLRAMIREDADIMESDVLESLCSWLNITMIIESDTLHGISWNSTDVSMYVHNYDGNNWIDSTISHVVITPQRARTASRVSMIDPLKSASITCEYKSGTMSDDSAKTIVAEDKSDQWWTLGVYDDVRPVSYVDVESLKRDDSVYYTYYSSDDGDNVAISDASLTELSFSELVTDYDDSTNIYSGYVGAIDMYSGAQVIGQYGDSNMYPTDVKYTEGILLYGVGMVWRANVRDYITPGIDVITRPLITRTYNIGQIYNANDSVSSHWYCGGIGLLSCNMRLMEDVWDSYYAVYENSKEVDGELPSLRCEVKIYLDPQHTSVVFPSWTTDTEIMPTTTDDTGTYITQYTYLRITPEDRDVYNKDLINNAPQMMRLQDAITVHYNNSDNGIFRIPDKVYVDKIVITIYTPSYYTTGTMEAPDGYVDFAHIFITNLKLSIVDKLTGSVSAIDTDTKYVWVNDQPNISGDEVSESPTLCSYDGKSGGYNVPIRWINIPYVHDGVTFNIPSAIEAQSNATSIDGESLHPEEVRLLSIARQYETPTFVLNTTIIGSATARAWYNDVTTGLTLRCMGNSYDICSDESNVNLVNIK